MNDPARFAFTAIASVLLLAPTACATTLSSGETTPEPSDGTGPAEPEEDSGPRAYCPADPPGRPEVCGCDPHVRKLISVATIGSPQERELVADCLDGKTGLALSFKKKRLVDLKAEVEGCIKQKLELTDNKQVLDRVGKAFEEINNQPIPEGMITQWLGCAEAFAQCGKGACPEEPKDLALPAVHASSDAELAAEEAWREKQASRPIPPMPEAEQ